SNQLLAITEDNSIDTINHHLGDFTDKNRTLDDYLYDNNGNLVADKNKGIRSIVYNYMNQPVTIGLNKDDGSPKGHIDYLYDNFGNKLTKTVTDSSVSPVKITRTNYIVGFQYQNDTLQATATEEGRARWAYHKYFSGDTAHKWEYDFFEKDHLGNNRILLTQQKDTVLYAASMEAAYRAREMALFYNIDSTSYPAASVPGGYPADATTSPNDSVARVNGSGHKVGPALLLKVMSGDSVVLGVKSFFRSGGTVGGPNSSIPDILNSLAGGLTTLTGGAHGAVTALGSPGGPVNGALNSFFQTNDPNTALTPKAYLNWMLLDNQFNYVGGQSGAKPVGSADILNTLATTVGIHTSGFLYIWVSNETPAWDVFFDNLCVKTFSGPLLEENHYYPFGLSMAGISDKALKAQYAENKYRYNGKEIQNQEFGDGSGLEQYDFGMRNYDPQIGRWWTIDPKADQMRRFSPYNFAFDNPIRFLDPDGMEGEDWVNYHDQNGDAHTDWVAEVHDQKGADEWAAKQGKTANGDQKDTEVKYVGKEGYQTNGYKEDGETPTTYRLNSNGTATKLGEGDPKPSTVKVERAETEGTKEPPSPAEQVTKVVGGTAEILHVGFEQGEKFVKGVAKGAEEGSEEAAQLGGLAKQAGAMSTVFKVVGKAAGVVTAVYAWKDAVEKGGVGRYTKAVLQTALIFVKANPVVSVILAIADISGLTDKLFDW
ncbi:MAG TPA: RHS repeat-associated core domain-containing protein, partial [Puia sp.]|nr:RHS repeat-associated core domain-containing protein [Puia sp.]